MRRCGRWRGWYNKNMENLPEKTVFDIEKSPIKEAYLLLGAKTPLELSQLYTVEDQKLMKSNEWDYANPDLITNKIKDILERIDTDTLSEQEREWRGEILWFWHHHAISCAIARYKDKTQAQIFAAKALEVQPEDHPNKITRLLYLLVNDKLEEAETWVSKIEDEHEKSTARDLVEGYKEKGFF